MTIGTAPTAEINGEKCILALIRGASFQMTPAMAAKGRAQRTATRYPCSRIPKVVATPPPPLNWKKTGQLCPTMTAMNEAIRTHEGRAMERRTRLSR